MLISYSLTLFFKVFFFCYSWPFCISLTNFRIRLSISKHPCKTSWDFIWDYLKSIEQFWGGLTSFPISVGWFLHILHLVDGKAWCSVPFGTKMKSRAVAWDRPSHHCSEFRMRGGFYIFQMLLWVISVPSLLCSGPWDHDLFGQVLSCLWLQVRFCQ